MQKKNSGAFVSQPVLQSSSLRVCDLVHIGGRDSNTFHGTLQSDTHCSVSRAVLLKRYYRLDIIDAQELLKRSSKWRKLDHNNILPLLGIDNHSPTWPGLVYPLGMNILEYLDGRLGVISNSSLNGLLYGIINGLDYLHSEKIVHGDLRGVNIIMFEDRPQLVDFNTYDLQPQESLISVDRGRWWSPERLQEASRPVTQKSDIYSFGWIVIEVYTLQRPFAKFRGSVAWLNAAVSHTLPDKPDRMEHAVWDLVQQCLEYDQHKRPTTEHILDVFQTISDSVRRCPCSMTLNDSI